MPGVHVICAFKDEAFAKGYASINLVFTPLGYDRLA